MTPRSFLFGLVSVPCWGYDWGYTVPQIDLMCLDVPIVSYGKKGPDADDIEDARERWERKYAGKSGKIDLNDILKGYKHE
jgi:hypothetical protein